MPNRIIFFLLAGFLSGKPAFSQTIPVEVFAGHKKTTLDIMFFRYFKNKGKSNSKFLFFNRNRAVIDYKMTESTNLPQFGFTEAISYNAPVLKGFAPVGVVQILNKGVYSKIGIQYVKLQQYFTFFGWTVIETINNPNIDLFILARYVPMITGKINLFTQLEILNNFPTVKRNHFNFIQRIRLGIKLREFQFGAGIDLTENGRKEYSITKNIGGFLRCEF